jgi:hypothetical protein
VVRFGPDSVLSLPTDAPAAGATPAAEAASTPNQSAATSDISESAATIRDRKSREGVTGAAASTEPPTSGCFAEPRAQSTSILFDPGHRPALILTTSSLYLSPCFRRGVVRGPADPLPVTQTVPAVSVVPSDLRHRCGAPAAPEGGAHAGLHPRPMRTDVRLALGGRNAPVAGPQRHRRLLPGVGAGRPNASAVRRRRVGAG